MSSISHGTTVVPRRNWKQWLWKIYRGGGGGKTRVHYCLSIKNSVTIIILGHLCIFLTLPWSFLFSLLWFKIHINSMASTNSKKVKQYPHYQIKEAHIWVLSLGDRMCKRPIWLICICIIIITTGVCTVDISLN